LSKSNPQNGTRRGVAISHNPKWSMVSFLRKGRSVDNGFYKRKNLKVIRYNQLPTDDSIFAAAVSNGDKDPVDEQAIFRIDRARLLAITFAKKAVQEIQSRLEKRLNGNGAKTLVCTFHSLGYRILNAQTSFGAGFRLIHDGDQLNVFQEAMEEVKIEDDPALLLSKVSLAKNELILPEDLEKSAKPEDKQLAKVFARYELLKRRRRLVDFDDLLCRPYQILERTYLDAMEYLVSQCQDLNEFKAHIEEAKRINRSSPTGKVTLITIHQAKGLEFKCVIVPGLNEGILPHVNSVEQLIKNLEEERRLMYVAMTRAMERLVITYRRRQMGQPITMPSRFLNQSFFVTSFLCLPAIKRRLPGRVEQQTANRQH